MLVFLTVGLVSNSAKAGTFLAPELVYKTKKTCAKSSPKGICLCRIDIRPRTTLTSLWVA
jgi:hypothetical protein